MARTDADASTSGSDPRWRDRSSRGRHAIRTLVAAVAIGTAVLAVAFGSVGAAPTGSDSGADGSSDPALVVADATLEPDETGTQRVSLSRAPDGLAGFRLTLAVADGDVAAVSNASYPDHYGLTTDPAASADGERITVEAADLGDEVSDGATDVTLATIDVSGVDDGETELRVTDLQVDADGGDRVEPSLEAGALTVADDSSEAPPGTGDEGSEPGSGSDGDDSNPDGDGSDSSPGFAAGIAVAAFAVLVAALAHHG